MMEMGGHQSLYSYLKTKESRKLPESEAREYFAQIAAGLSYLHEFSIAHRDLKLENLMLNDDRKMKLIDLGFSIRTAKGAKLNVFCGTPSYMAPELVKKQDYIGAEVDCWALGVILYVVLCGKFPFKGGLMCNQLSNWRHRRER